jgi:hypothetical protein
MGTVPPKLMPTFPRPRNQWDPKNDDPSQYSDGLTSVLNATQCLPGGQSNTETLTLMHTIEDRICLHDLLKGLVN